MENVMGMLISGAYVAAVLGVSAVWERRGASKEATRKLVHIALGGWWLIAAAFFTSPWWAAALPALFIVVNAYLYRSRRLTFMARDEAEDTPGTVYYAASLTLLAWFSFWIGMPFVGALGMFCMSFGDGFAAVLGKRFGRPLRSAGCKSLVGSVTMFAVSFISCAAILLLPVPFGAGLGELNAFVGALSGVVSEGSLVLGGVLGLANASALAGLMGVVGPLVAALLIGALLAAAATLLEFFSVEGVDNLSVPLGVSTLFVVLFLPAAPYTAFLMGAVLSGMVALASLRLRLLTLSAALGATVVGALAFAWGGWPLWLLLMWFFGSSNVASKIMARRRARTAQTVASVEQLVSVTQQSLGDDAGDFARKKESSPRKLIQVLANSVPFLVCAFAYAVTAEPWLLILAAGALAACTADTWASEIGTYSKNPPVNILTRRPMQRGLSGGVSSLGLVATVVGSAITALLAMLLFGVFGWAVPTGPIAFLFITACGVVGSLVDSVLGVLLQAKYRMSDKDEDALVETSPRPNATGYTLVSGYAWVTNDAVNLMSGIAVVLLGLLVV